MQLFRTSLFLVAGLALAACEAPRTAQMDSGSVYRTSETNSAMRVAACTVVQARYVTVVDDSQSNRDAINQAVGIGVGAALGNAIGKNIGGGSGRDLAKGLGTVAGGVVGSQVASNINTNRRTGTGVEYTIDLGASGLRTIVQNLNQGEGVMRPGSACVITGNGATVRVRPA